MQLLNSSSILLLANCLWATIITVKSLSSQELCQSSVCSGCIAGSLSCQEGGLSMLPDKLSPDIQSMILIGHQFDNPTLSSKNFSNYPQQTKNLQRLVLRNCGVEHLKPGALQNLHNLNQLDLSQNRLKFIEPETFIGLRLELLRLDENPGLCLRPGALRQATITSLSMNHCGLTSLKYEDLEPLFNTGMLINLHLSGNKLLTLESRLEPIFLQLKSLSIEQNPFTCDCRLRWLTDTLQRRALKRQTRALSDNGVFGNEGSQPSIHFDGDLQKPVCNSPERLSGKTVEKLEPKDFYCELPRLKSLDLDMRQLSVLVDSKVINQAEPKQASNVEVILRCQVEGSPELQMSWYRRLDTRTIAELGLTHNMNDQFIEIPVQQSNVFGSVEVRVSPSNFSSDRNFEHLLCIGRDLSGNTSAEVRLQWPNINLATQLSKKPTVSKFQGGLDDQQKYVATTQLSVGDEKIHPSLAGWYGLTTDDSDAFWLHQKQFSALQMIGAVVCTFTITLILFISGCCLLKAYRLHQHNAQSKLLLNNSESPHHLSLLHCRSTAPPSYSSNPNPSSASALLYQSTGKIDAENRNNLYVPSTYKFNYGNHLNENGIITAPSGTGISDVNRVTTRPAYEPITVSELSMSVAYGDSQTYDVPHYPSNFTTPTLPLPPIPTIHSQNPIDLTNHLPTTPFVCTNNHPSFNSELSQQLTNTSPLYHHPMFIHSPDNLSSTAAAISMAATLGRLQNSPFVRGQLPPHSDSTLNPHQLAAFAAAQHQMFNLANRSNIYGPTQSNSETIT